MGHCRLILFSLFFVCGAFAAAHARAGESFPAYSEIPPVQSYNPNTGETGVIGNVVSVTTTPPSVLPQTSSERTRAFEAQPLAFPDDARPRARNADGTAARREVVMPSVWPALLSVFGVCALFCGALYLVKKYLPGHRQIFNHPAIEVLGRTHLDQKRYVSLVRVGKRVVVVGVSPDEMRPLSEITDEAEITEIMEVARPKTEAGLSLFQKLFKRNVLDGEAEEAREMADLKAAELREQMAALKSRVAQIAPARDRAEHFDAVG